MGLEIFASIEIFPSATSKKPRRGVPETAIEKLVELFQARDVKIRRLNRGIQPQIEADDLLNDASELA